MVLLGYTVILSDTVKEELENWDRSRQERFSKKIKKLEEFPTRFGKPLRGSLAGIWELYFEGSFRILYSIDQKSEEVYVKEIRHKDEF